MKTLLNLTSICAAAFLFVALSTRIGKTENFTFKESRDTSSTYPDGFYEGHSQSIYASEPFWGQIEITVANGSFTDVKFKIRDSLTHENVDSMYGVIHYSAIPEYMDQCVNEEHGIEIYPVRLIESQDLENVDAISHATWSYNIFIASAIKALEDPGNPDGVNEATGTNKVLVEALPNPFNSTVNFRYRLPGRTLVNLSVFNQRGMLIKQLVNKEQVAGNYLVEWNNCPSGGVYYYRLQAGNVVYGSKVVSLPK